MKLVITIKAVQLILCCFFCMNLEGTGLAKKISYQNYFCMEQYRYYLFTRTYVP